MSSGNLRQENVVSRRVYRCRNFDMKSLFVIYAGLARGIFLMCYSNMNGKGNVKYFDCCLDLEGIHLEDL